MSIKTPAAYCDVFDRLAEADVRYVVVSGVAVVLHGHARPVFDLDMVVSPRPDEQNSALHTLMLAGFVPSVPVPLNLLTVMRLFDQSNREVDVFVKYHLPFNDLWADSVQIHIGESVARVASLEHLLRAKRTVGRPHDLMDVEGLLKVMSDELIRGKVEDSRSLFAHD
jgi:hypothetical protein